MMTHGSILEVAVVAKPDDKWGEVPAAFVTLKPAHIAPHQPTELELIKWCRTKMAGFQSPKEIKFLQELPKTSTGKVQKHALRKFFSSS
jgi:fatty-acyl-CoA synthase